jgi:hypothetical protein
MSLAPNLVLRSEVLPVQRRDFTMAVPSLLNPNAANPLVDGEWLQLDSTYKVGRGADGSGVHEAIVPSWQVFAERGRYDTQAIGKVPLLFIGGYEAETTVCNLTGITVGEALVVSDVTFGSLTRRGLAQLGATSGERLVFAFATAVLSDRVRYWCPNAPARWTVA